MANVFWLSAATSPLLPSRFPPALSFWVLFLVPVPPGLYVLDPFEQGLLVADGNSHPIPWAFEALTLGSTGFVAQTWMCAF